MYVADCFLGLKPESANRLPLPIRSRLVGLRICMYVNKCNQDENEAENKYLASITYNASSSQSFD